MSGNQNIKFTEITDKDAEIIRTISFMTRLKDRAKDFRNNLLKNYEEKPEDLMAAFAYGLFNLLSYNSDDLLDSKTNVESALNTFEEILEQKPEYWLVRMFKIRLMLMLPNNYRDEDEIIEELNWMIDIQKNTEYRSYFVIPYILLAEFYFSTGEKEKAKESISNADLLEKRPVNLISDFLVIPFKNFEKKLKMSNESEVASKVNQLGKVFFPKEYKAI